MSAPLIMGILLIPAIIITMYFLVGNDNPDDKEE